MRKIRRIIGQRIIDLTVSDTPCHHNIGCRMGFREHVLDLLTRPDIPVRHIVRRSSPPSTPAIVTVPFHFRTTASMILKDMLTLQPHTDQIDHNIITGTDGRGNGRLSFLRSASVRCPAIHRFHGTSPAIRTRSEKYFGLVSISICIAKSVPNSGMSKGTQPGSRQYLPA